MWAVTQRTTHFALEFYKPIQAGEERPKRTPQAEATTREPNFTRPRLISIIIDDLASKPEDRFLGVTKAIRRYIETDMGPGDQIEILSDSGRVQYPFSNDKQLLLEEVATLQLKLNWNPLMKSDCPSLTDLQAQMIYNNRNNGVSLDVAITEALNCLNLDPTKRENIATAANHARMTAQRQFLETNYRNRALLRTLCQHLRSLRHFDATKCAILFSDGFLFQDVVYEIQDVVDQALRSGVALNAVDIRLYEDGKQQEISSFDEVNGESGQALNTGLPHPSGDMRRGKTVLILFDDRTIAPSSFKRTRDSAERYVREHMRPQDLFAVVSNVLSLKMLQNFSDDPEKIVAAIRQMAAPGGMSPSTGSLTAPGGSVSFIRSLDYLSQSLERIRGRKSILLFSENIVLGGDWESHNLYLKAVNSAKEANVVFFTIEPQKLEFGSFGNSPTNRPGVMGIQAQSINRLFCLSYTILRVTSNTGKEWQRPGF